VAEEPSMTTWRLNPWALCTRVNGRRSTGVALGYCYNLFFFFMQMSSRNVQCQICACILCRTPPTQVTYLSDPVSSTGERLWSSHQMRMLPSMHQNIHIRWWWWWLKGI
jgi:hypothetical protein